MGPPTVEVFCEYGAEGIADTSDLTQSGAADEIVEKLVTLTFSLPIWLQMLD